MQLAGSSIRKQKCCPHCHKPITAKRSPPDHRRFFAVINAAFLHWPETHEFQPDNPEHLRAWLTAKAGYRDTVAIPIGDGGPRIAKLAAVAAREAIKAAKGHSFVVVTANSIGVVTPKSIAWDKLSQTEFGKLRDAVEEVLQAEAGLKADDLLRDPGI